MKIQLVDRSEKMCNEWKVYFNNCEDVIVHHGDFFELPTDCIVSAANSFGHMRGGLDGVITKVMGRQVELNVKHYINKDYDGELLVGQAVLVPSSNRKIPWCISAPTMRVSMNIVGTVNPYLAAKAVFRLLKTITKHGDNGIETITMSGLGTGVGGVTPTICAKQMKAAYDEVWLGIRVGCDNMVQSSVRHNELTQISLKDLQLKKDLEDKNTNYE